MIGPSGARGDGKKPVTCSPVLRSLKERATRAEMRTIVLIIRTVLEGGEPSVRRDREVHGLGGDGVEGELLPKSIPRSDFDGIGEEGRRSGLLFAQKDEIVRSSIQAVVLRS